LDRQFHLNFAHLKDRDVPVALIGCIIAQFVRSIALDDVPLGNVTGIVEHLEDDLAWACRELGLRGWPSLPRLNTSCHGPREKYYDGELLDAVAILEAPLIEAFGYSP
jgi:hypothetical protein